MNKIFLLLLTTFIFAQPDGYDCNGELNGYGFAELDDCDICTGGNNTCFTFNEFKCGDECFSGKEVDNCSVCNLDSDLLNFGDLNDDDDINVTDVVMIISIILFNYSFNTLADMDGNCTINVVDVVAVINQILYGPSNTHLYSNDPDLMTPNQTTTTIQTAIQLASDTGMDLLFERPDLTYTIDATIWIPSDMKIDFNNSIIRRETGDGADDIFDMLVNQDPSDGNDNIVLKNLIIDGNRENDTPLDLSDDLSLYNVLPDYPNHRFSGLKFSNVSNSKLMNITVKYTVNGEHRNGEESEYPAAGIFFTNGSNNIYCKNINAYYNDYTGIIIYNSTYITIDGSDTSDNTGSGIGSTNADNCNYYRITSEKNGHKSHPGHQNFSNISINGECSVAYDLTTSSATGSGLNIGHPNPPANADLSFIKHVESFDNELEGIMLRNSDYVQLDSLALFSNQRNNFLIKNVWDNDDEVLYDASNVRIRNATIYGYHNDNNNLCAEDGNPQICGGYGLRIEGIDSDPNECGGHIIDNAQIYNNFYNGIGIINLEGYCGPSSNNASVWVGDSVSLYNNGQADKFSDSEGGIEGHYGSGIRIYYSKHSQIDCPLIHCDEEWPDPFSQDVGIHITDGGEHNISTYYLDFSPDPYILGPMTLPCSTILIESNSQINNINGQSINGDYSFDPNTDDLSNWNNDVCE